MNETDNWTAVDWAEWRLSRTLAEIQDGGDIARAIGELIDAKIAEREEK